MHTIEITLSEADFTLLKLIASDVQQWVQNAAEARAAVAKSELRTTDEWMRAVRDLALSGSDALSEDLIVIRIQQNREQTAP